MRTRLVFIAPLLTLVLAACGGGGSNSSSTTSAPTTTASSTPATAGSDTAATARAQKLVLVQADFPAGWTASPPTPDTPESKTATKELNTCIGTSGDEAHSADVKGNNFTMGPTTRAGSKAQVIKEEATYRRDLDALKSPKLQPCIKDFLTKALTSGVGSAPASVQISSLPVPSFGDLTVGLRMTAGITTQGQNLTVYLDSVLMCRNRAEVSATFLNVGQPFDAALQRALLDKLGAKLTSS